METIEYKEIADGENLSLHVAKPEGWSASDKRPAVVFFFGGGWAKGTPTQFYPYIQTLAKHGIVGISAEYRTQGSHGVTPVECVKDAHSAIRYVRQHAAELGIDPDKLMAGGGSAGGHLAQTTTMKAAPVEEGEDLTISTRPSALILFNPVLDLGPGAFAHNRFVEVMGEGWKSVSPYHNIDADFPPSIIQVGTKDQIVPVEEAEAYKARMEAVGVRCDVVYYEGQGHAFFNQEPFLSQTQEQMIKFLKSLGYAE